VKTYACCRHCLSLQPDPSKSANLNTSSFVLHHVCFYILPKRGDSSCHSAHRKSFLPKSQDISSFEEVVQFASLLSGSHREGLQRLVAGQGRGIVIPGGGAKQLSNVWVLLRTLRWLGCTLPVEIMYVGTSEMTADFIDAAQRLGDTTLTDMLWFPESVGLALRGWPLKIRALMHSKFAEVIMLDADNVPLVDPSFLFSSSEYKATGALFWHDFTSDPHWISPEFWGIHVHPFSPRSVLLYAFAVDFLFQIIPACECRCWCIHKFLYRVCHTIQASLNSKAAKWSSIARAHGMRFLLQRKLTGAMPPTTGSCAQLLAFRRFF
jgi:hypothetical protein